MSKSLTLSELLNYNKLDVNKYKVDAKLKSFSQEIEKIGNTYATKITFANPTPILPIAITIPVKYTHAPIAAPVATPSPVAPATPLPATPVATAAAAAVAATSSATSGTPLATGATSGTPVATGVSDDKLNVFTYNLDKAANNKLNNIAEIINNTPDTTTPLDFVGLQGAYNYLELLPKTTKLNNMKYIHHKSPTYKDKGGMDIDPKKAIVSFYNPNKFNFIAVKIGKMKNNELFQLVYLEHKINNEIYLFINIDLQPGKNKIDTDYLKDQLKYAGSSSFIYVKNNSTEIENLSDLNMYQFINNDAAKKNAQETEITTYNNSISNKNVKFSTEFNNDIYKTKHIIFVGSKDADSTINLYDGTFQPFEKIETKAKKDPELINNINNFNAIKLSNLPTPLKTCCINATVDKNADYILISDTGLTYEPTKANIIPEFLNGKDMTTFHTSTHLPVYAKITTSKATAPAVATPAVATPVVAKPVVAKQKVVTPKVVKEDIIIIGAGPVGLYSCIKLLDSTDAATKIKSINIFEKKAEDKYTERRQQLIIDNDKFEAFPDSVKTELMQNVCKIFKPNKVMKNICYDNTFTSNASVNGYSVMINNLQIAFKTYINAKTDIKPVFNYNCDVKKINKGSIDYKQQNAGSPTEQKKLAFTTLIVSSSTKFIPNDYGINQNDIPGIPDLYAAAINIKVNDNTLFNDLNLKANPSADDLGKFTKAKIQNRLRFFRQQKDDLYIGINLSKDDYDKLNLFKNTNTINKTSTTAVAKFLFDSVVSVVSAYTNKEITDLNDILSIEPGQISVFKVELKKMDPYANDNTGGNATNVYVIGDAARNTHFFSAYGVNFGFDTANKATDSILDGHTKTKTDEFKKVITDGETEIIKRTKAVAIDLNDDCGSKDKNTLIAELQIPDAANTDPLNMKLDSLSKEELCHMTKKALKAGAHAGLVNGCNKCWLNAGIQLIGYMDDFVKELKTQNTNENIKRLFTDLTDGSKTVLNYGINFTDTGTGTEDNYGNLYNFFANDKFNFPHNEQRDADEGLNKMLDYFAEIPINGKYFNADGLKIDNRTFIYTRSDKSECKHKTDGKPETVEVKSYFIYPLEVPNNTSGSVKNLKTYFEEKLKETEEIIDPSNFVNGCKEYELQDPATKGPVTKSHKIETNKYFIIQLKIFSNTLNKIQTNLTISKQIEINSKNYNLSGFIQHIGPSLKGGHYVFYKVFPDGSGILYDDKTVSEISEADVNKILTTQDLNNTPYVLLYEEDSGGSGSGSGSASSSGILAKSASLQIPQQFDLEKYIENLKTTTEPKHEPDTNYKTYENNGIIIRPYFYNDTDQDTDFKKLIVKDEFKNTLFIFNENYAQYYSCADQTDTNASIRSYKCAYKAWGLPIGNKSVSNSSNSGHVWKDLNTTLYKEDGTTTTDATQGKKAQTIIDEAIMDIKRVIKYRSNTDWFVKEIIYSGTNDYQTKIKLKDADKNEIDVPNIALDTYLKSISAENIQINDDIISYMVKELYEIPKMVDIVKKAEWDVIKINDLPLLDDKNLLLGVENINSYLKPFEIFIYNDTEDISEDDMKKKTGWRSSNVGLFDTIYKDFNCGIGKKFEENKHTSANIQNDKIYETMFKSLKILLPYLLDSKIDKNNFFKYYKFINSYTLEKFKKKISYIQIIENFDDIKLMIYILKKFDSNYDLDSDSTSPQLQKKNLCNLIKNPKISNYDELKNFIINFFENICNKIQQFNNAINFKFTLKTTNDPYKIYFEKNIANYTPGSLISKFKLIINKLDFPVVNDTISATLVLNELVLNNDAEFNKIINNKKTYLINKEKTTSGDYKQKIQEAIKLMDNTTNYFDEITSYYTLQSKDDEINKEDSIYVKFSKTAKTMYNIYVDYDNNEKFDILNDMILNMNSNENTKIILGYIIYANIFNNNEKKYKKLFFNKQKKYEISLEDKKYNNYLSGYLYKANILHHLLFDIICNLDIIKTKEIKTFISNIFKRNYLIELFKLLINFILISKNEILLGIVKKPVATDIPKPEVVKQFEETTQEYIYRLDYVNTNIDSLLDNLCNYIYDNKSQNIEKKPLTDYIKLKQAEKAAKEAEEKDKKEAEEKDKKEAEEKAKQEAEEKDKKEAEEKAKQEAEEKAKKDAEGTENIFTKYTNIKGLYNDDDYDSITFSADKLENIKIFFIWFIQNYINNLIKSDKISAFNYKPENLKKIWQYLFIVQIIHLTIQKYIETKNINPIKLYELNDELYVELNEPENSSKLDEIKALVDDDKTKFENKINEYANDIMNFIIENENSPDDTDQIIKKYPNIDEIKKLLGKSSATPGPSTDSSPPVAPTNKIIVRLPLISTNIYAHPDFKTIPNFMTLVKDNFIITNPNIITEICLYESNASNITIAQNILSLPEFIAINKSKFEIKTYGVLGLEKTDQKDPSKKIDIKNCIVVDPAGSAFADDDCQQYYGSGGSGAIYRAYNIFNKFHSFRKITAGEAKFNSLNDNVFSDFECKTLMNNNDINKQGSLGIIHAVGPNGDESTGMDINTFCEQLGKTLKAISDLINTNFPYFITSILLNILDINDEYDKYKNTITKALTEKKTDILEIFDDTNIKLNETLDTLRDNIFSFNFNISMQSSELRQYYSTFVAKFKQLKQNIENLMKIITNETQKINENKGTIATSINYNNFITMNGHGEKTTDNFDIPEDSQIYVMIPHYKGTEAAYTVSPPINPTMKSFEKIIYDNKRTPDFGWNWKLYSPGDTLQNINISDFKPNDPAGAGSTPCANIATIFTNENRGLVQHCINAGQNACIVHHDKGPPGFDIFKTDDGTDKNVYKIKICGPTTLNDVITLLNTQTTHTDIAKPIILIPFLCNASNTTTNINLNPTIKDENIITLFNRLKPVAVASTGGSRTKKQQKNSTLKSGKLTLKRKTPPTKQKKLSKHKNAHKVSSKHTKHHRKNAKYLFST